MSNHTTAAPYFHTLPLWVLDAARSKGASVADITDAHVTAKTAVLSLADADPIKVFRRNAFPGRASA